MDINKDYEVMTLVEALDDAIENTTESFLANFAERQMSDWMSEYGATEEASKSFSELEEEILQRALRVIRTRWEKSGNQYAYSAIHNSMYITLTVLLEWFLWEQITTSKYTSKLALLGDKDKVQYTSKYTAA